MSEKKHENADVPQSGKPTLNDPLALDELFAGGGEPWLPLLKPVIEKSPSAETFIGPKRPSSVVPVRELTFQALKPNPPDKWRVVVFGQNPYPRIESATGIAMFDNTFNEWKDSKFGRVTSIRCIIKAACIWKHGIDRKTPIADIRKLLADTDVVMPPEWFQAMLTQGVLLLNAALTASEDGSIVTEEHTSFWRPVVETLIEEILKAKHDADDKHKGVVFGWWGAHARNLKSVVDRLSNKFPDVPVRHVNHCNPAAQGDIFCKGDHFGDINGQLKLLGMDEVDWLPAVGWDEGGSAHDETSEQMGEFITKTMELHKFYLERLQEVAAEIQEELPAVVGVLETPLMSFDEALLPVVEIMSTIQSTVKHSQDYGLRVVGSKKAGELTADEIAAVYLYTTGSNFYRQLNATLRSPVRENIKPYFPYLRLLFSALTKLKPYPKSLWRGVAKDLRPQYPKDATVTWWGVSSCTSKVGVAKGFLGSRGRRMLFEVVPTNAFSIRNYSAFTGEEEYILLPGTRLKVIDVTNQKNGLCEVKLEELAEARLVS
ncbi:MAG: ADP-ribosyltransferase domain-containing protein [Gemmataceae bacterium]